MAHHRTLISCSRSVRWLGISATRSLASKARVVVVGSGRMGAIRARLVESSPRYELAGIVDPAFERAKSLASEHGVHAYVSVTDAIEKSATNDTPLTALIVSSPTFSHEAVITEAADNKIAVFTEKPVAETANKIAELFEYADKSRVLLCCSFQRRFDPSYVAATQVVQTGQIGTPVMAQMFFADHPVPPRQFMLTGGNIFMDLSAHDVDYIMYTLQDRVVSVYAVGTSSDEELAEAGVCDNATMVMNFSRGATVTLFMSRAAVYGYDQRCEIFGSKGLVSVKNVHQNTTVLSNADGVHRTRLEHSFPERFNEAFALELNAFADVLAGSRVWPITGLQCVNVQRVADAARLSAEAGSVVPVDQ